MIGRYQPLNFCSWWIIKFSKNPRQQIFILVGNVGNMLACVATMPTMPAKNWPTWNIADVLTGFMAGSCVSLDIYLIIFYLDIYIVNFFLLHNSDNVSLALNTRTGCSNCWGIVNKTHGHTCDVHHFGGGTVLLSMRTMHGFGGLLHRLGNGTGRTHHLICFCCRKW